MRISFLGASATFVFWCFPLVALPQSETQTGRPLSEQTLEELLAMEISVASEGAATTRESSAIVTVITQKEIEDSGARDLIDVLRLVPGIEFGVDVEGVVGIGMRGNWGHEGKVLLRVDRHEMNEPTYSNLAFGNHLSVDQIAKIEIIRGPGSARFGGYAELAVIDITTKIGAEQTGLEAAFYSGFWADEVARLNGAVSYGQSFDDKDAYIGVSASHGFARRSDASYVDFLGSSADMTDSSRLQPTNVALHVRYKQLDTHFMVDNYHTTETDSAGEVLPAPNAVDFRSYSFSSVLDLPLGTQWTLSPELKVKVETPWRGVDVSPSTFDYYDADTQLVSPILRASYLFSDAIRLDGGVRYDFQRAVHGPQMLEMFPDGSHSGVFHNTSVFSEASFRSEIVNVLIGARYEHHASFGGSFVPRVGVTKVFDPFHFKFLASSAFRSPGVEQINVGQNIEPERTQVFEFEGGYRINETSFIQASYFDITIDQPIVYTVVRGSDAYANFDDVGTRGVEIEYRFQMAKIYADLTYSFYHTAERGVPDYLVLGHRDLLLGFPAHKFTLKGSVPLIGNLSLNPSAILTSQRYAYASQDAAANPILRRFGPELVLNLFLLYRDLGTKGLDLGAGVYDVTGTHHEFLQPYDGGHAPLPGPGREFVARVSYSLD